MILSNAILERAQLPISIVLRPYDLVQACTINGADIVYGEPILLSDCSVQPEAKIVENNKMTGNIIIRFFIPITKYPKMLFCQNKKLLLIKRLL